MLGFLNEDHAKAIHTFPMSQPFSDTLLCEGGEGAHTRFLLMSHRSTQQSRVRSYSASASTFDKSISRRILVYLIPLRLLRGHSPSRELLEEFPNLDNLYTPFIQAMRKGDVKAYDDLLNKWQQRLIELNTYLTLERAREVCLRSLFRRV